MNGADDIIGYVIPVHKSDNKIVEIEIPKNGEIINVQIEPKSGLPCIWTLIRSSDKKVKRKFELIRAGSGLTMLSNEEHRQYIGSVKMSQDSLILMHVFEIKK